MGRREFQGSRLRVEISHGGSSGSRESESSSLDSRLRGTQYRVRVSNLATSVSWQNLKDFLREGGDVAHADVDRRGNGVASFATHEDMERAIRKLDSAELMGERVRIREERASGDDNDTYSRGGSRSGASARRRSRSRSPRSRSPRRHSSHRGRSSSHSRSLSPPRRGSRHRSSRSRSRSR